MFEAAKSLTAKIRAKFGAQNVEHTPEEKPAVKVSFEHQRMIDNFLSIIAVCPMDVELKSILRMRVWGKIPTIFMPLTYKQIAQELKCKIDDVKRWEQDGLYNIEIFLKKYDTITARDKFIRDNKIGDLINPQKRIIA